MAREKGGEDVKGVSRLTGGSGEERGRREKVGAMIAVGEAAYRYALR